jgi:hypothetical protein
MRALLLALLIPVGAAGQTSIVVVARDPAAVNGLQFDSQRVRQLVRAGLTALTGAGDERSAWQQLVNSNDVVGIKISTLAAPLQVTRPELIRALADGLRQAGVAATNIIVFDRDPKKLRDAGYAAHGYRLESVVGGDGWDAGVFYEHQLAGKLIWGDRLFGAEEGLSTRSHFPRLLTQTLTKLINVPVVMDHEATGLAGALYSLSLGLVDNWRRFEQFGQRGDPFIAALAREPAVRDKLVLNVVDGLRIGYAGGPSFKMRYSVAAATLWFSRDPVATDTLALEAIEQARRADNLPSVAPQATHIATAAETGLGIADRQRIHVISTGP